MLKRTQLRCASLANAPGLATLVAFSESPQKSILNKTLFSQVVGIFLLHDRYIPMLFNFLPFASRVNRASGALWDIRNWRREGYLFEHNVRGLERHMHIQFDEA
jgi:hypothetical protein